MKKVVSAMPHPHLSLVHIPVLWYVHTLSLLSKPTFLCGRKATVVLSTSVTDLPLFTRLGHFLADYWHGGYPLRRVLDGSDVVIIIFKHETDLELPILHVGN